MNLEELAHLQNECPHPSTHVSTSSGSSSKQIPQLKVCGSRSGIGGEGEGGNSGAGWEGSGLGSGSDDSIEIEIETATESGELGGEGRMGDWTRGEAFR